MYSIRINLSSHVDAATINRALQAFQQALNMPKRPILKAVPQHHLLRNTLPLARPHGVIGNVHSITTPPRAAG